MGTTRTSSGSIRVMNTIQKKKPFSGVLKNTMAKAVSADSATLPTVTRLAMTKLFSIAVPRLARDQAAPMFSKRRSCGTKLKGMALTCWNVWLAPDTMTMKGPISSSKPKIITP
ncbi:hypothetical protein D9M72_568540 [compost metagenome]